MWQEQKSGTRGDSRVCHWCSYHILTCSVIYYWTDARQHGIYLFYIIIKKQTTTDQAFFFFIQKSGLCPVWRTRKKAIWRNLLPIQNAAISLVAMRSKDLWLVQENHATVKLDSKVASRLTAKAELNCKIYKYYRKYCITKSVFAIRAALWAEKLASCLVLCGWWFSNQSEIVSETPFSCDTVGREL